MGWWKKINNPEMFQGNLKKRHYFEGWYFKIVDPSAKNIFAIIPGVSLDRKQRTSHSFIQVLDGIANKVWYFRFPLEQFWASEEKFEIRVGRNYFSRDRLHLEIDQQKKALKGDLHFRKLAPWPKRPLSPGIMGPFSYLPIMETYHGVVSMNHEILGTLNMDGKPISFDGGKGYIEKDWGRSFPSSWIWMQSNHFNDPQLSIMVSIAKVPILKGHIKGFLVALWRRGRTYAFTTYTGAKIQELEIHPSFMRTVIKDKKYHLEVEAKKSKTGDLKAPDLGIMKGHDRESITSQIRVRLRRIYGPEEKGKVIIDDIGRNSGLEIMDRRELAVT
jgi:hypothetical protein